MDGEVNNMAYSHDNPNKMPEEHISEAENSLKGALGYTSGGLEHENENAWAAPCPSKVAGTQLYSRPGLEVFTLHKFGFKPL